MFTATFPVSKIEITGKKIINWQKKKQQKNKNQNREHALTLGGVEPVEDVCEVTPRTT